MAKVGRSLAVFAACVACGVLMDSYRVPFSFGLEFFFGGIFALVAVARFGPAAGAAAAVLIACATLRTASHPFFVILGGVEAFVIGHLTRRLRGNLLVAAAVYWVTAGALLTWLFYGRIMGADAMTTLLALLKHAVNGICNALVATLLLAAFHHTARRPGPAVMTFQQLLFNTLVALVFVPAMFLLVMTSRARMSSVENELIERTRSMAQTLDSLTTSWQKSRVDSLAELGRLATQLPAGASAELERDTRIVAASGAGFIGVVATDKAGRSIASFLAGHSEGRSPIHIDLGDRPFFAEARARGVGVSSPVLISRGPVNVPTIVFAEPIMRQGAFDGVVAGAAALGNLRAALLRYKTNTGITMTILDQNGAVVASTDDRLKPLDREPATPGAVIKAVGRGTYQLIPAHERWVPSVTRWESAIYGVRTVSSTLPWTLVAETPLKPYLHELRAYYIETFAYLLVLCLVGLAISHLLTRSIGGTVERLAAMTSGMPARIEDGADIAWPSTSIRELGLLIANLKTMAAALRDRFQQLQREVEGRVRTESRLVAATAAAESANRAKSEFLANMSHEIRTPLGAVLGFTELLSLPETPATERGDYLLAIRRNGEQLRRLIDDVLDFSKVEAGHVSLEAELVSLDEVMAGSLDITRAAAEGKGVELAVVFATPMPASLVIDQTRLKQILLNIAGNAVKFTDEGFVRVSFGCARSPEHGDFQLKITVEDTGIGVAPAEEGRLFRAFGQIDSSSQRRFGGTGLGLALSRRLAQAMGGDLRLVTSSGDAKTTFEAEIRVGIPSGTPFSRDVAETRARGRACRTGAESPHAALAGLKILVVEDAPDNRLLFSRALRRLGAAVELAESGAVGVEKASAGSFDVVLMDVQMPEMDGLEATRRLRRSGYHGPIVALTAHALPEDRARCLQAGCNNYLTKPVDWPRLADVVYALVARHQGAPLDAAP